MADVPFTQGMGSPVYAATQAGESTVNRNVLTNMTNLAAAGLSLALIAGVGVWGYKLMVRDVTGIPVVQAAAGEMRVRPEDPGGQLALNQGLAVNEVAAAGVAAAPADRLTLAPKPVALTHEDMPVAVNSVAPVQQPAPVVVDVASDAAVDVSAALEAGSVDDLVRQLTLNSDKIIADDTNDGPKVVAALTPQVNEALPSAVVSAPGVTYSLRPKLRPASAPSVVVPVSVPAPTPAAVQDVQATTIPAGTRLVQLGAFDSPEVARAQWDILNSRFGDYMQGKSRIVQKAESGGRTFYRLRAMGFADLSEARRFCSAFLSKKADCIPVVTR